jgi:pimeloyl-ACP methyl ester carboxylesterase
MNPSDNNRVESINRVGVADIDVAYKVYGEDRDDAPPLVLIMGYGCTMDIWPPALIDELSAHRRVIVFDNRGMGLSTDSDKELTIELLAGDTADFLKKLGLQRVHLLGWSMGAFIAQEVALRHPERIEKLVLYAGYCGGTEALRIDERAWGRLTDISGTIEERITRMFGLLFPQRWLEEHPDRSTYFPPFTEPVKDESIVRQAGAMARWAGTYDRLHLIRQSTPAVTGTVDTVIPPGNAFILGQKIPGASVIQIEGGGHGVMYQYPRKIARLVSAFLED